jgi:3-oxoadipate enol-lactonase
MRTSCRGTVGLGGEFAKGMNIRGKTLEVEQQGDGDAVLMVHGLGGTSNTWYAQRAVLARSFKVVCPDLDGSCRSPSSGSLSIAEFVADMVALLDALAVNAAHLVGHSMGTVICQHLAASYPERVKSMALLGPLAEPPEPARKGCATRPRQHARTRWRRSLISCYRSRPPLRPGPRALWRWRWCTSY